MSESPLHFLTITEVAALIRNKQVSPVEVTEAMLQRIDALDGRYQSYATVMADQAMDSARKAENEIAAGRYLGPLHGVPIGVKDLCFTKGVRTMGGTPVLSGHVPNFDATVISKLAAAGSVLLGKLNLTEGAMAGYHPDFPIPVNPWNSEFWTGVSSSGSGVATAAGLCFGSLGSDTGGSIRFPAASCGVVGIKPTWGLVSRYGVLALAESMDHVGPITRSAADAGIMLQAIAGHDPNDPTSLPGPALDLLAGLGEGVREIRIGLDLRYVEDDIDGELATSVLAAIRVMEGLGAEIVDVTMPETREYTGAWAVLCSAEATDAHRATYPSHREEYGPWFRGWLDKGSEVTGVDYAQANNVRAECNGLLRRVFEDIDVLACPSTIAPPGRVTPDQQRAPMGGEDDLKWGRFTVPFDFNGAPTISLPCGQNSEGLPLSLQFVGKHLSEALLVRLGHAYEQATNWHNMRPPV
ncbi:MAG: Asp-tRNA(Asn)/Glu-tRNA(Gln) amidotransferase GatCAB subunit A [Planctomyces sp.]|nr:Asp-tRNA(Asn)/Glu-tRNA(Gln) amidotransferase GatCAB subunit A [Planctomyces sp.]